MFLNTMKNASFSWSDYKELYCRLSTNALARIYLLLCILSGELQRKTYRHSYPMRQKRHVELFGLRKNKDKLP